MQHLSDHVFNQDAVSVARLLVGAHLYVEHGDTLHQAMITETEAYEGTEDLASHASRGKTDRTAVMFGPPAHLYVYLVYGMHWMLNVVTGSVGHPGAVLIRGCILDTNGERISLDGPGKLTKALGITGSFNEAPVGKESGIWFAQVMDPIPDKYVQVGPRIGVSYAGVEWSEKPYRFFLDDTFDVQRHLS